MKQLTLHNKVLFSLLVMAILPLLVLAFFSFRGIAVLGEEITAQSADSLDRMAAEGLETRAQEVALQVERFLQNGIADVASLALLPVEGQRYLAFSHSHRGNLWRRDVTTPTREGVYRNIPLYREVGFISLSGEEIVVVRDGKLVDSPRRTVKAVITPFGPDPFVERVLKLHPGQIDVTHLLGLHVSREDQLRGAASPEEADGGQDYSGIIRFSMLVAGDDGRPRGIVTLAMDHRHLMEFTRHLTPTPERRILYPSYDSGNYAFMFDDEGWMIAHPKLWDIRGVDHNGQLVPPLRAESSAEQVEHGLPFNLFAAGFIHPNYPLVAAAVLHGKSGVVDVTNVGGSRKIMAFAPIRFAYGSYERRGIFGGVTIGAEVSQFHSSAQNLALLIHQTARQLLSRFVLVISCTILVAVILAYLLARGITDPLQRLMEGTQQMARGRQIPRLLVSSQDEVGALTQAFNRMSRQLGHRNERLLKTLTALRRSRRDILRERNFKEAVFEHIETGIVTLDQQWGVTSCNTPLMRMLALDAIAGTRDINQLLAAWPDLLTALNEARMSDIDWPWSRYVTVVSGVRQLTFRMSLLALRRGGSGQILTIEDVTERVNLRQRLARIERLASLGRLSAGIAHEIRNPLTGVSLLLDDLHDRALTHPDERRLIRSALDEIERLERLVTELLHFAAIPKIEYRLDDIGRILRQSVQLFRQQFENRDILIREEYAENLHEFSFDSDKIKQAFINLLSNAYDAMPNGGTLTVSLTMVGDTVHVEFRDNGVGISNNLLPLIFEPFFTTKGEGTGLGLAITHTIIAEHGGRIDVVSALGQGSRFIVSLPMIADHIPVERPQE